jgi:hypothetical protein
MTDEPGNGRTPTITGVRQLPLQRRLPLARLPFRPLFQFVEVQATSSLPSYKGAVDWSTNQDGRVAVIGYRSMRP